MATAAQGQDAGPESYLPLMSSDWDTTPWEGPPRSPTHTLPRRSARHSDSIAPTAWSPAADPWSQDIGPSWDDPWHQGEVGHAGAPPRPMLPAIFEPTAYPRSVGRGEPLLNTSWRNRPAQAGWFIGVLSGDAPIRNRVDFGTAFFGGFRLGWDYDYYWGVETRLGLASIGVRDNVLPQNTRSADVILWDASLLYYPWGDSRWRPYLTWGLGVAAFDFFDDHQLRATEGLLGMPVGGGLKYMCSDWIVLRADVIDNIAFGSGRLNSMHNVSASLGMEFRFGGTRTSYWPWNPSPKLW